MTLRHHSGSVDWRYHMIGGGLCLLCALPVVAMFSQLNTPKGNRVLGQVESVLLTDLDNTIETMRLF